MPLVDQLFVARLVQFLRIVCGRLPTSASRSEAKTFVDRSLWALFEDAKPGSMEIDVNAHETPDGTAVAVTVRPRRFLGVALEEISLELPIG